MAKNSSAAKWTVTKKPGRNGRAGGYVVRDSGTGKFERVTVSKRSASAIQKIVADHGELLDRLAKR